MSRQGQGSWEDERGFTLIEVMLVILLIGTLSAIAIPTLFGVIESRRVDSATNQLAADLRQTHTKASNRLEDWQVVLAANSSTYTIGPVDPDPADLIPVDPPSTHDLDEYPAADRVVIDTAATITFEGDGSAVVTGANPITVESSTDNTKNHPIDINPATSRISVVL